MLKAPRTSNSLTRRRRASLGTGVLVLSLLALPASAFAQATRTWVSGLGSDANPCSRTAPCKTFAAAYSMTAAGGEIDAQDPGGYGTVTISKSLTIDGGGGQVASVLVSGTNGITVTAGSGDRVILRNLRINGVLGSTPFPGLDGVKFVSGGSLHISNVQIFGFGGNGVNFNSTTPNSRLSIANSTIENNAGSGLLAVPGTGGGSAEASVTRSTIDGNGCGISIGAACGVTTPNTLGMFVGVWNSSITNSGTGAGAGAGGAGIYDIGNVNAAVLSFNDVSGNTIGLDPAGSGVTKGIIYSLGNNSVFGNAADGAPTNTIGTKARDVSRLRAKLKARELAYARQRAAAKRKHAHHVKHKSARH